MQPVLDERLGGDPRATGAALPTGGATATNKTVGELTGVTPGLTPDPAERFLWTVLLADGTRALTRAGHWAKALDHVRRHRGIGQRLLDGRQVLVLAHCATGDHRKALDCLDASLTQDRWENAVAAALRLLCLRAGDMPFETVFSAAVANYLTLDADRADVVFRSRLGLSLLALASSDSKAGPIVRRLTTDAQCNSDVCAAAQIRDNPHLRPRRTVDEQDRLTHIVAEAGPACGLLPPELLADLKILAALAESNLRHAVARSSPAGPPLSEFAQPRTCISLECLKRMSWPAWTPYLAPGPRARRAGPMARAISDRLPSHPVAGLRSSRFPSRPRLLPTAN